MEEFFNELCQIIQDNGPGEKTGAMVDTRLVEFFGVALPIKYRLLGRHWDENRKYDNSLLDAYAQLFLCPKEGYNGKGFGSYTADGLTKEELEFFQGTLTMFFDTFAVSLAHPDLFAKVDQLFIDGMPYCRLAVPIALAASSARKGKKKDDDTEDIGAKVIGKKATCSEEDGCMAKATAQNKLPDDADPEIMELVISIQLVCARVAFEVKIIRIAGEKMEKWCKAVPSQNCDKPLKTFQSGSSFINRAISEEHEMYVTHHPAFYSWKFPNEVCL